MRPNFNSLRTVSSQILTPQDGNIIDEQGFHFILERYLDGGEIKSRTVHAQLPTP